MTLMEPISAARSAEKSSRERSPYGKDAQADRRRRQQHDGGFAAVLAEAMRR